MDDELKIIVKATLDENSESELNKQLKSIKLDPISLKVNIGGNNKKIFSEIEKTLNEINNELSRKVIKNPIAKSLFKEFDVKNMLDKQEISKSVEEYQNALKIGHEREIISSYENLFKEIKNSFYKLKKDILQDHEKDFLNYFKSTKIHVNDYVKSDLGKDNYKYYLQNMMGKITTDSHQGMSADALYSEIHGMFKGVLPHPDEVINETDRFMAIADKFIDLRSKLNATFDDEDILWNIGYDKDIKKRIDSLIGSIDKRQEEISRKIKNIKSELGDMSEPNFVSLIQNALFDVFENSTNKKIKIPFQVDISNPEELKDEMERIVSSFTKNKGKIIDYKVKTQFDFDEKENKQVELLSGATLKYKNKLDEVITKELKWQQIGEEVNSEGKKQAVKGFAESYSSYSQNVEKATQQQEKLKLST